MWQLVRRWHPADEDATNDEAITEIRESLDEVAGMLKNEEPEDFDVKRNVQDLIEDHNEAVADMRAQMEEFEIDDTDRYMSEESEEVRKVAVQPFGSLLNYAIVWRATHARA